MRLIQKIKSYYIKHDFYRWKDIKPESGELSFTEPNDDVLMDIGTLIRIQLKPASEAGNERHRLPAGSAVQLGSIDEVLMLFRSIINEDLRETTMESRLYSWEFRYRCDFHPNCRDTITISTVLKSSDKKGYCVYNVASVRLFDGNYHCWSHLR